MISLYSHPLREILTPENMVNRLAKVIIRFPLKKEISYE